MVAFGQLQGSDVAACLGAADADPCDCWRVRRRDWLRMQSKHAYQIQIDDFNAFSITKYYSMWNRS